MIKNKSLNKDILSNQTRCNRHKALEIILFGGYSENKAIQNIVESVDQQTFDFISLEKLITSSRINFKEIYDALNNYGKGAIPVIIATVFKKHISHLVIEKNGKEVSLCPDLLEQIEKDPVSYWVEIIQDNFLYENFNKIFDITQSNNIFYGIVDAMQRWFFSISKYASIIENKYIGKGTYIPIDATAIKIKTMLRGIQENPYWFLKYNLLPLLGENGFERLRLVKDHIDNTITSLKFVLLDDVNSIFPETISIWYHSLPKYSKIRIYYNGEERFFDICKNAGDNINLIDDLAFYLTGLSINNWNENTPTLFYKRLKNLRVTIEGCGKKPFKNGFDIKFIDYSNKKSEFIFDLPRLSNKETIKLLKKDIVSLFEDYGNSVSNSDKIEAILEVVLMVGEYS